MIQLGNQGRVIPVILCGHMFTDVVCSIIFIKISSCSVATDHKDEIPVIPVGYGTTATDFSCGFPYDLKIRKHFSSVTVFCIKDALKNKSKKTKHSISNDNNNNDNNNNDDNNNNNKDNNNTCDYNNYINYINNDSSKAVSFCF